MSSNPSVSLMSVSAPRSGVCRTGETRDLTPTKPCSTPGKHSAVDEVRACTDSPGTTPFVAGGKSELAGTTLFTAGGRPELAGSTPFTAGEQSELAGTTPFTAGDNRNLQILSRLRPAGNQNSKDRRLPRRAGKRQGGH